MANFDSTPERNLISNLKLENTVPRFGETPGEQLASLLEQMYVCTEKNQLGSGEAGVLYVITNFHCNQLCGNDELHRYVETVTRFLTTINFIVQYMFLDADPSESACAHSLYSDCDKYPATQCSIRLYGDRTTSLSDSTQSMLTCPKTNAASSTSDLTTAEMIVAIAVPFLSLLLICSICAVFWYKRAKLKAKACDLARISLDSPVDRHDGQIFHRVSHGLANYYMDIKALSEKYKKDQWEVPLEDIIIDENHILGNGAFAVVHKATVKGKVPLMKVNPHLNLVNDFDRSEGSYEAAVKRLPRHAVEQNKIDFFHEISFMKNLGYHAHVISMLGCVSCTISPIIIVEYCEHGDLLHFVRKQRNLLSTADNEDSSSGGGDLRVRIKDLVSIAWQVSDGLTYLSSKNFIHRDVAARNVLLTKHLVAKVSDFGLGRYADSALYTARGGRLPFKSMALEALKYYEFSEKSDVWAFAILLFEVFSFGDVPYAAIQPTDMISHVEQGNRPEQPERCPDEIFALMTKCWRADPTDRPTFSEARSELTILLNTDDESYGYLNLGNESRSREYCNIREVSEVHANHDNDVEKSQQARFMGRNTEQRTENDDTHRISHSIDAMEDPQPITDKEQPVKQKADDSTQTQESHSIISPFDIIRIQESFQRSHLNETEDFTPVSIEHASNYLREPTHGWHKSHASC